MRKKVDEMCRESLAVLANALFDSFPGLIAVYWQQSMTDTGLQLTAIRYTDQGTTFTIGNPLQTQNASMVASVTQFGDFLKTISYHLFCAYGAQASMMITPEGIVSLPA
jgi:hypothetical protein